MGVELILNNLAITNFNDVVRHRSTFYAHYQDKDAMVDHFENQILTDIRGLMNDHLEETMKFQSISDHSFQTYPVVDQIIEYINHEFDLIRVLLGPKGDHHLEEKVESLLMEIIDADLFRLKGKMGMTREIPDNFAHKIIVSGLMSIIKVWLLEGNPESPEEISKIIMKTRYMSPYDLLGIDEKPTKKAISQRKG